MKYYLNKTDKTKDELFDGDTHIVFHIDRFRDNNSTPVLATEWLRQFLSETKPPTEAKVRQAMIYTTHERERINEVSYKVGGGSVSDNMFESIAKTTIADSEYGEDIFIPVVKIYSTNFKETIITPKLIYDLCVKYENEKERKERTKEEDSYIAHFLICSARRGDWKKVGIILDNEEITSGVIDRIQDAIDHTSGKFDRIDFSTHSEQEIQKWRDRTAREIRNYRKLQSKINDE